MTDHMLIRVLIADDETIVREGLKYIVDWTALGFSICGEARNGEEALRKINDLKPDLVLLDIRMPRLSGTELIETVRGNGYTGEFIILSGYSEFKYAQTAIRYGVSFYLTKPIDEDELEKALLSIREKIRQQVDMENSFRQYISKAKAPVLTELLRGQEPNPAINYMQMGLLHPVYQVVIYEWYSPWFHTWSFADLLRVSNEDCSFFEHVVMDSYDVVILKGNNALDRFQSCLRHYEDAGPQKGSPLSGIFLACGQPVYHMEQICQSFAVAKQLVKRRFFCEENQHVLSYDMLPQMVFGKEALDAEVSNEYSQKLLTWIQAYNRREVSATLHDLRRMLYTCDADIHQIKYFLSGIFLQIKQSITHRYSRANIPFASNAAVIELLENKRYLYEIMCYFSEQFEMIIRAIGNNSSDSVFDDILFYINQNYSQTLKLESIAPLFGYNSSYLGKLFSQKMGQSFNSYLDQVRLLEAAKLLEATALKVYEISEKVGYKNVDYFHQKFRRQYGKSPAEYRKEHKIQE